MRFHKALGAGLAEVMATTKRILDKERKDRNAALAVAPLTTERSPADDQVGAFRRAIRIK